MKFLVPTSLISHILKSMTTAGQFTNDKPWGTYVVVFGEKNCYNAHNAGPSPEGEGDSHLSMVYTVCGKHSCVVAVTEPYGKFTFAEDKHTK
jgi:hypothetical protein